MKPSLRPTLLLLTLFVLAPAAAHAQQNATDALFAGEGSDWTLSHDELLLPAGGVVLLFMQDRDGRPIISFPTGGDFKPRPKPHFPTTNAGQRQLAFTIGYEKGAVDLVCRLPDEAEANEIDCTCTQGETTAPCPLRRKRRRRR